jgi:hypothetical protein
MNSTELAEHVNRKVLRMIVVYHHATDYPDHNFVARQWFVIAGRFWAQRQLFSTGKTLREVREAIPVHLVCIPRLPGEDEAIIETWI